MSKTFFELKRSNASVMVVTPSFIDLLLLDKTFNEILMPSLHTILFCGEKLRKTTVEKLFERFKNIRIINSYGPTECTFAVTSVEIDKNILENQEMPVGISKEDVDIYIVDENMTRLQDGEIGEIVITGESVGNGYLGEVSKKSFIQYNNKNAYLTGDLGFFKENMLFYKERKDKQIKYKGYRIELSDIEENLQRLEYIEKAVTIAKKNDNGIVTNIFAFVKLRDNLTKEESEIKNELLKNLPEYMCPKIKIVKEFPINKNGKCDENKLLEGVLNGRTNY